MSNEVKKALKQLGCIIPVLFIALLLIAIPVSAHISKRDPELIPCWKIEAYIWLYGQDKAYTWATSHYNAAQIDAVRKRCNINWNANP